jgi:DNA-binding NarL/FixJ family response regulator
VASARGAGNGADRCDAQVRTASGRGYGRHVTIRVAVADDSVIIREGLERLLAGSPSIEVVAECNDLPSLVRATDEESPEVVLTDIRMPPTQTDEGIRFAREMRERHPQLGVIVLSQFAEPAYVLSLLASGSDRRGYLLKERVHNRGELISAIDNVSGGGSVIDPKIVEMLVAEQSRAEHSPFATLTEREQEVLAEIATGKSNNAIADSLVLTKRAVEKHINSIFSKLDLASADDVSKRVKATLMFLAERGATHAP